MRVLVTGASGFIGRAICATLAGRAGVELTAGVHWADAVHPLLNLETARLDLTETTAITETVAALQPQIIVNAAAYGVNPKQTDADLAARINTHAPAELYAAGLAWGLERFVHLGSVWEYGPQSAPIPETAPLQPRGVYAATKAAGAEALLTMDADVVGTRLAILRPLQVWGPGEKAHRFVPSLVRSCLRGEVFPMTHGRQVRDFDYVHDVAAWIAAVALRADGLIHKVVNLGSGRPRTLLAFAREICDCVNPTVKLRPGVVPARIDEPEDARVTLERLNELVPDRKLTPVAEGAAELARWLASR